MQTTLQQALNAEKALAWYFRDADERDVPAPLLSLFCTVRASVEGQAVLQGCDFVSLNPESCEKRL